MAAAVPLCWSYARVSTTQQVGPDRSGLERQHDALHQWLAAHPDYVLQGALVDAGIGAGRGKHRTSGALARFIQGGRDGTVPPGSCLVVESMSRFSREVATTTLRTLLNDVWGAGLAIAFCSEGGTVLDEALISREDHRLYGLLGSIAQARREWEERSSRSSGGCAMRRKLQDEGRTMPGRKVWWIETTADGSFRVLPTYLPVLREIVRLATNGMGRIRIAQLINDGDWPAPPKADRWSSSAVRYVLLQPALIGTLRRRDRLVLGYYPPVITAEEHQQLQAALDVGAQRHRSTAPRTTRCHNLFQGIARCCRCNAVIGWVRPAKASRAGHRGYIWCPSAGHNNGCQRPARTLPYEPFEAHVLTRLDRAVWSELLGTDAQQQQADVLRADLHRIEAEQQRAVDHCRQLEQRAEEAWAAGASEERQATIERTLAKARQQMAALGEQANHARAVLALAVHQPDIVDLQQRIREFQGAAATASGQDRLAFNRWLMTRLPDFRIVVDTHQRMIGFQMGEGQIDWQPLAADLATQALQAGANEATFRSEEMVDWPA